MTHGYVQRLLTVLIYDARRLSVTAVVKSILIDLTVRSLCAMLTFYLSRRGNGRANRAAALKREVRGETRDVCVFSSPATMYLHLSRRWMDEFIAEGEDR